MKKLFLFIGFVFISVFVYLNISTKSELNWDSIQQEIQKDLPSVKSISVEELDLLIGKKENFILLDVRTKKEFDTSHIFGAINIEDTSYLSSVNIPKDAKIIAYCSVGYRSGIFLKKLQEDGYKNIYNVKGSIFEWANKGYPVYRDNEITESVHPYNAYWGQLLNKK